MTNFDKAKKLLEIRTGLGLNQAKMAERLGLNPTYLSQFENDRRPIDDWYIDRARELEQQGLAAKGSSVELANQGIDASAPAGAPPAPLRQVPVVSWAAAGSDDFDCAALGAFLGARQLTQCDDPHCFALFLEGDSMEPKFSPGDVIIIQPNADARNGDLVLARLRESRGLLFRRLHYSGDGQRVCLSSYHPAYPSIDAARADFRWIFRVYGMTRRFPN